MTGWEESSHAGCLKGTRRGARFHLLASFSPADNSSIIQEPLTTVFSPANSIRKEGAAAVIIIVRLWLRLHVGPISSVFFRGRCHFKTEANEQPQKRFRLPTV